MINNPEKIPGLIWDNTKEKFSKMEKGISYAWDSMFGDKEESTLSSRSSKPQEP
ncbi:hypothetical protein [Zooshikella sp. RANM57]|uniref:hypothetical protein n=1 Tax=Zooshikella sp. RANM57 TaxID=3425863 RepID=UPI003D6EF89E